MINNNFDIAYTNAEGDTVLKLLKKTKYWLFIAVIILLTMLMPCSMAAVNELDTDTVIVPILMYHNLVKTRPNKYEVTVELFENDLKYLKDNGYHSLTPQELVTYVRGAKMKLPDKPIMLTFDDGFYNCNKYLISLLEKYDMYATVAVVGDFTKYNKTTDAVERYTYVDLDDIKELNDSGRITIANHSNKLHTRKNGRVGAEIKHGEDPEKYRKILASDTNAWEQELSKIGIKPIVYAYPYGAFCKESEEVLTSLGYQMTFSCEERVNYIKQGKESCLRKMGRYNRDSYRGSMAKICREFELKKS